MSWQTTKTTADYTPAYQLEAGKLPKRCTVQAIRCVGVAEARRLVDEGRIVWVRAEEWERGTGENGETVS